MTNQDHLPDPAPDVPEAEYDEVVDLVEFRFTNLDPTRREFVKVLGAGLLIAAAAGSSRGQAQRGGRRAGRQGASTIEARLHIGQDGTITVMTGKVECGQGARAELTQAAAEELHVGPGKVRLIMADTALVPDDGGTFGSRSTPSTVPAIRQGCASARELLASTAARRWGVEPKSVSVLDGRAIDPDSNRTFSYGDLASDEDAIRAFGVAASPDVELTPVDSWKVLGTQIPRPNARDLVTGSHAYPSDITRPGMLFGKVLRRPSYGARLLSVDLESAKEFGDVLAVRDGDFVGVVAPSRYLAGEALEAITDSAEWEAVPHPSSDELFDYLRRQARGGVPGNPFADEVARASKTLRRTYHVPYVQHAPMEPRAAVAEWDGGQVTVWTATQNPFAVRGEVARAFGLADEKVRVIIPDFGGGFGGKHSGECAVEAARLARAAGKPVRLVWTREEEFTWAQFRPAGVIQAEASLDAQGRLTSWYFVNINSGGNEIQTPYQAGKNRGVFVPSEPPLRHGSYRALATTANTFGRECFMDELAEAADLDPLRFRLDHLEPGRLRDVLEAAARRFDWDGRSKRKEPNIGIGLACGLDKGSFVAACVEVELAPDKRSFEVKHVCQAYECGKIVNPGNLLNQVKGAILMGLGPALHEEARFQGGKILNASFGRYRVPRFEDVPELDIHLIDRPDLPSVGAGETPLIAIAPAIANALYSVDGRRSNAMPIRLPELV
ncbi:molybdopterin cofactor-binding domain-containing protein [Tundrisphaera lichenicola]|uniref:xanthine dehydrogenase family protein molybdopterin-binding subunit n=1 Tax=Tundrisphaera lichenicola TaxID=2029860 RepID=UPI003EBCBD53